MNTQKNCAAQHLQQQEYKLDFSFYSFFSWVYLWFIDFPFFRYWHILSNFKSHDLYKYTYLVTVC